MRDRGATIRGFGWLPPRQTPCRKRGDGLSQAAQAFQPRDSAGAPVQEQDGLDSSIEPDDITQRWMALYTNIDAGLLFWVVVVWMLEEFCKGRFSPDRDLLERITDP